MLPSQDVVQEVPVFGAWVSPCCLEPILLLEQRAGDELVSWCFEPSQPQRITSGLCCDDDLMLRAELHKKVPVVIAVSNSLST